MLLLEPEFPRADCITPSQVSILKPYAGNSAGIPLVPSKPHFPKFSSFRFMCLVHESESTCFWYDNELISCCSRIFHGLVMVALGAWPNELEQEGDITGWSFTAFCHVTSALYHMRNDEIQLSKEGFNPYWTCVPFLILIGQAGTDGDGLQLSVSTEV